MKIVEFTQAGFVITVEDRELKPNQSETFLKRMVSYQGLVEKRSYIKEKGEKDLC